MKHELSAGSAQCGLRVQMFLDMLHAARKGGFVRRCHKIIVYWSGEKINRCKGGEGWQVLISVAGLRIWIQSILRAWNRTPWVYLPGKLQCLSRHFWECVKSVPRKQSCPRWCRGEVSLCFCMGAAVHRSLVVLYHLALGYRAGSRGCSRKTPLLRLAAASWKQEYKSKLPVSPSHLLRLAEIHF